MASASPADPMAYTPSSPPSWFMGGSASWNLARRMFVYAERLNVHGTQNQIVGLALLAGAFSARALDVSSGLGLALAVTGWMALCHGLMQRAMTRRQMGLAIGGVMMQCANPTIGLWANPDDRAALARQAQQERLASPPGSFDELMNAVAEAGLTGRSVNAPLHWWSGRRFEGFRPGPAGLPGATPPNEPPRG